MQKTFRIEKLDMMTGRDEGMDREEVLESILDWMIENDEVTLIEEVEDIFYGRR